MSKFLIFPPKNLEKVRAPKIPMRRFLNYYMYIISVNFYSIKYYFIHSTKVINTTNIQTCFVLFYFFLTSNNIK